MERSAFALKKFGKIRVGLIGDGGMRTDRHITALSLLSDYELICVHPRLPSALGIEVARDPLVDLVAIVDGTPRPYDVVREAMLADKDVFCDWPIDAIVDSADAMFSLGQQKGVRHFVGLRLRLFPAVRYMGELVARGHCGKISSLRLIASSPVTPPLAAAPVDDAAGIPDAAAHFLDAAFSVAGFPKVFSALVGDRSDGARWDTHLLDQTPFCMIGVLDNEAIFSVHLDGCAGPEACLSIEISGDEGNLRLCGLVGKFSDASLIGQRWSSHDLVPLAVPRTYQWLSSSPMPSDVIGVANLYAAFARDLHEGTHLVPVLEDGVLINRILALALRSSELGHRVDLVRASR